MRRPLCLICLAFVVSVFIGLQLIALPEAAHVAEGSRVIYSGEVYHKEYRYQNLILYLRDVNQVESTNIPISYDKNAEQNMGILCYVDEGSEPKLGSYVLVSGEVSSFSKPRNPGGFDQEMYYRTQNIGFPMKNVVLLAESETYSIYREGLYRLRRYMEQVFERTMSEKDASIMKAMVLGNKTELDRESKQLFQQSGISHVLAISGLHISLIGMGLYKLLRKLRIPVAISAVFAVGVMVMYGDMVGMSSSAFRAIFMFGLKMGAEVLHRTYDMLTALAMAAVGILIEQPLYIYHAGFLLSFGAIIGVGCMLEVLKTDTRQMSVNRRTQKKSVYIRNKWINKGKESLLGSGSIFLIHFPIMLSVYYEFPVYSFLLNLLIIPAMSLVMGLGLGCMLCGCIGVLGAGVSQLAADGCHLLLEAFEVLCEWSMTLPGASWIVGEPEVWRIVLFYVVVLLLFLVHKYCKYTMKEKVCLPFGIQILWILVAVAVLTQKTYSGLTVTMLDVGQGDCIWIETQTGHHYMIDGGSTSEDKLCEYTIAPFLKQTGTSVLDAVFLTHLDKDHTSGILELLEAENGIRIERIVIAKAAIRDESYDELVEACRSQEVELIYAETGDRINDGTLSMEVLHPTAEYETDSHNAYSLVLKLEYGSFHALFTGDVEADGEMLVAESLPEDWECHLYKVAHHGSRNSNTEELLHRINPQLAIISCAEDNSYGHPHEETLDRLAQEDSLVLTTPECGAITVEVDKKVVVRRWIVSSEE